MAGLRQLGSAREAITTRARVAAGSAFVGVYHSPELDVDYHSLGDHWWEPALSIHRDPGSAAIGRHMQRDPKFAASMMKGIPIAKALSLLQLVMVVLFPLETLLVWWLPSKLALSCCQSCNDFTYVNHTADNAQGDKSFDPFRPAADSQPALYLGFDANFDNRPVALYVQVEPPQPAEVTPARLASMTVTARPQLTWEYVRANGDWASLGAIDETQAFARRGLIRFVGPRDFARRRETGHTV